MSNEASKTRAIRGPDFAARYLSGRVIDIGCGPDLVVPHAEPFDLPDGDAGEIASLRPRESYDAVHSSHCLEHMNDVPRALSQWWELVRRGGYLVLVVPEEDLYEQKIWPSRFNSDHKATFRLNRPTTWSNVSYDIQQLVSELPDAEIISAEIQDQAYDYSLVFRGKAGPWSSRLFRINGFRIRVFRRLGVAVPSVETVMNRIFHALGTPIDQSNGPALAQIQIVARKSR